MTLGSVAKVWELGMKTTKKHAKMIGWLHLSDRMQNIPTCLDQDPDLIWSQDHF